MHRPITAVMTLALSVACQPIEPAPKQGTKVAPPASTDSNRQAKEDPGADRRALARAQKAAKTLGATLKRRLQDEMKHGGPPQAFEVCSTEARPLTHEVAQTTHARVGRTSLRTRNPANSGPPWVTAWLEQHADSDPATIEPSLEVSDVEGTRVARVINPIRIEAPCLACHGDPKSIDAKVRDGLTARYPGDMATGYALGDLRGALWAEVDVDAS